MNDLNKGEGAASDENLEDNQGAVGQQEAEKDRLLEEAMQELRNEHHSQDQILHMAKRLAQLKGQDPDKGVWSKGHYNLIFLPSVYSRISKKQSKTMQYNLSGYERITPALKSRTSPGAAAHQPSDSDDEELPWCCICNHDATLRCHTCDGDLYCSRCFR
ncbi:hypothetical protein XENOCAPTIV_010843 [Xenoophorus captivus]|uniref:Zinc finger, FYVE domain containing 19 n=1 Tax=Xenoophorus captivus TaxID=1517983 RepID=A0ABV0QHL9_9TELE